MPAATLEVEPHAQGADFITLHPEQADSMSATAIASFGCAF